MTEDRSVLTRPAAAPDDTATYGEHADQLVELWHAPPGRPPVVVLHGGFWRPEWDRRHLRPMAAGLRDAGWPVAVVEYRREPGRPDHAVDDVRAALRVLPGLLAVDTVLLAGHSAGGQLALWAAAQRPVAALRAVLALAPVADLVAAQQLDLDDGAVRAFLGGSAQDRPDLDPRRLPTPGVPVTVLHGSDDPRVPARLSASYAADRPTVRLVAVPGADHFALIDPASTAWPLVLDELRRL